MALKFLNNGSFSGYIQLQNTKNLQFIGSSGDHARIFYTQGDGTTGDVWSHGFYQNSGLQASIEFYAATEALANGNIKFKTGATANTLVLGADQNATFAGTVTAPNLNLTSLTQNTTSSLFLVKDEVLGGELVTNGDFDTNTDWTLQNSGSTISGGKLNQASVPSGQNVSQSTGIVVGDTYKAFITISSYSSGGVRILLGSTGPTAVRSANGTFVVEGIAAGNTTLYIQAIGTTTLSVDNISVKQIISSSDSVQERSLSSGAFGDELWAVTPTDSDNIYNLNSGNVAIGNTSPQAPLHVTTNADLSNALILEFAGTSQGGPWQTFQYNEGVAAPSETGDLIGGIRARTAYASGGSYAGYGTAIEFRNDGTISSTSHPGKIEFYTTSAAYVTPALRLTIDSSGNSTFAGNIMAADDKKIILGNSSDLEIYHDGDDSYIDAGGQGDLRIDTSKLRIRNAAGTETMIIASENGSVELYHNDVKKLQTFSTGVTITGNVTATTFFGDLNGTINTATTAVTQPNATDNTKVATTAFVVNKIAELPAGLIFLGTWDADTNDPELESGGGERSEGTATTLTTDKLIDSAATFTTAPAVVVGDRVRVVTPAGPEFALVTSVDSATQLTLAADIVTATGEAYILEVSPFIPEGNYYIVSTSGDTDLNGITDWKVGDWVVASSTNVWQKIDNSSVLDGAGTGGSFAGWAGSGDSVTLGNAPVTFSGNNSTFAGALSGTSAVFTSDAGVTVYTVTTQAGAKITFSDEASSRSQKGFITYKHVDTASYGSGNAFIIDSDQATMTILADGKLMYKEGVYLKPATGTGAGTRKDNLWDAAYNDKITGLAVTGTTTKTLTATQQDGGTLTASWADNDGGGTVKGTGTATRVAFWSASDTITSDADLYWDNTNNRLGIGTDSPSEKLQVKGSICVNSESISTATEEIDKISFKKSHPNGVSGYYTLGEIRSKTFGGYSGGLNFYTNRATTPGSYASTFAMTIDNFGKVGIGTNSPDAELVVSDAGGTGLEITPQDANTRISLLAYDRLDSAYRELNFDGYNYTFRTSGNVKAVMLNSGNVGIGVTSPSADLHVNSENTTGTVIIGRTGNNLAASTTVGVISFPADYNAAATNYASIRAYSNALSALRGSLDLNVKSTSGTLITGLSVYGTSAGARVGIGTATPTEKLDISGTAIVRSTLFTAGNVHGFTSTYGASFFINNGGGNSYFNATGGNVGIGATNPFAKLEVTGSLANNWAGRFENTNSIGYGILAKINSTDSSDYIFQARTGATNVMTILGDGHVGIGTTTSQAPLHVVTTTDLSDALILEFAGTYQGGPYQTFQYNEGGAAPSESGDLIGGIRARAAYTAGTYAGYSTAIEFRNDAAISSTSAPGRIEFYTTPAASVTPVERLNISSSGNATFQESIIFNNGAPFAAAASIRQQSDILILTGGGNGFAFNDDTNATSNMLIDSGGNVAIGYTAPNAKLHVLGSVIFDGYSVTDPDATSRNAYPADQMFTHNTNNGVSIIGGQGGFTGCGLTIGEETGRSSSFNFIRGVSDTNGGGGAAIEFSINGVGTATFAGDVVAYGSPSDKRLKENIKPIDSALEKVIKLQGVTFDWKKSDSILDIKQDIGFIAQDVQKVIPELVRENEDGMLSMRHQGIAPILLEAIKELKAEIEELKLNKCNCNK